MNESQFWNILALLEWEELGDDEAVVEPAVTALSRMTDEEICGFQEILAEKLYALDTEAHARHIGEYSYKGPGEFFSVDEFLYTRCAVVANGEQVFDEILADPTEMPEDAEFEAVLSIAAEAYARKNGDEFEYTTRTDYETFSNEAGWKQ